MNLITVINDSSAAGYVSSMIRVGEIYLTDVKSMVTRVIAAADGDKIKRLRIFDHGNKTACSFGADSIEVSNFERFGGYLAKLAPHFDKSGEVILMHCEAGQNEDLLNLFAAVFNVAVYGGTGASDGFGRNTGTWVRCSANGTIYHDAVFKAI